MKIQSILFPVVSVMFVAAVGYYIGGSIPDTKSEQQPISAPVKKNEYSAKIREIEADFGQRRQKIEDYYANIFQQLQAQSNENLRHSNAVSRTGRARSVKQASNPEFESYVSTRSKGRLSTDDAALDGKSQRTVTTRVEGDPSSDFWQKASQASEASDTDKTSETDRASETAKAANNEAGDYNLDFEHYERQKACALSDLEKERQLALTAVYNQQTYEAAGATSSKACGTVMGILSSDGVPMTIIDGNVTKEGQIINGVKVVKISHDCVEFRYAKKQWSQKVNETPPSFWP